MFVQSVFGQLISSVDTCPWGASAGRHVFEFGRRSPPARIARPLYTPEEKRRRDASPWTMVQGVLAPIQFVVFAISLALVVRFLLTGQGAQAATISIVAKTFVLYTIMVTGAVWEHDIYGKYLFAPAFFWEDTVSMVVIGMHTFYMWGLLTGSVDGHTLMVIALVAYATYVANAIQFVLKLRAARLADSSPWHKTARSLHA